jgi:glyoxylase-like metal-dependent hydrolase (beta-lactamase superfamily II)
MKKIIKRVLIGIGIFIAILILLSVGFLLKFKSETKHMNPVETGRTVDNIFSIKDSFVNMFLIRDSAHYIAIDAGNSLDDIAAEFKKLDINPDQVTAVFLTHTDKDHVAAIKLFKNARVFISRKEEQMINGEKSKFLFFGNHLDAKNYLFIEDGETLMLGNTKIKGILTPGHTSGSMCYLADDKYLFTGDLLRLKEGKIAEFNKFFNMDSKEAKESIGKITNLPGVQYIFTAHYGYTADYQFAVKNWTN